MGCRPKDLPGSVVRSMIIVDQIASEVQRGALIEFVRSQIGKAGDQVAAVRLAPFHMELDLAALTGQLSVGDLVHLSARKARPNDCICSNESAYYPPLAKLEGFVPGVTLDGRVSARSLGTRWSIPDTRTAYLGTFLVP